jgi:hypothetical protein
MATDIGSLASGLDVHALELGIMKNMWKPSFFFWCPHFSTVDSLPIATPKSSVFSSTLLAYYRGHFGVARDIISFCHYTNLVMTMRIMSTFLHPSYLEL